MRTDSWRGRAPAPVHVLFSLFILLALFLPAAGLASHTFRANAGIWAEDVLYLANRGSHAIYFEAGGVVLDIKAASTRADGVGGQGSIIRMRFEGANPAARIEAIEPTSALYSYYIGGASSSWRRGVREYGGVAYRDLWPGLDLVFRDLGGRMGYAIVAHGGNASQARWTYEGADRVVQSGGSILVETANGSFTESRSFTGVTGWLNFDDADDSQALSPTPEVPWSSFLGGGLALGDVFVSSGPNGSTIVAGNAGASYAPEALGDYGDEARVGAKIFVARFSATRQLEWVCFLGGTGTDLVHTLKVGQSNILIGGESSSADFPKTLASLGTTSGSGSRAFLARLSVTDGTLIWTRVLGLGYVQSVAVLSSGLHYAVGRTSDPAFPTTSGAFDRTPGIGLGGDGFVTSLDLQGNLRWSTLLGGTGAEMVAGVALDALSRPVVTGRTNSTDFPTTVGAYDRTLSGGTDNFVSCLTSDGTALAWSTYLGGSRDETVSSITLGRRGEILVGGGTESADYPAVGALARPHSPISATGEMARDGFVTALAADGRSILWSSCLGGTMKDEVFAVEVDAQGRAVVAGTTLSSDFSFAGSAAGSHQGAADAFVVRFAADGAGHSGAVLLGGGGSEAGRSLVCLPSGSTLVGGLTTSSDYPTTANAHDSCFEGQVEIFVSEILLPASGTAAVARVVPPQDLALAPLTNSPNPFNPVTEVSWELKEGTVVDLKIYDVAGRLVRTLLSEAQFPAGRHSAVWNGENAGGQPVASGTYLCRLQAGGQERTTRMTLLK